MTNSEPPTHRFPDVATLVEELASQIAVALKSAIDARGAASLVVSGGKSPVTLFEALRLEPIDWSRVSVALVDERWVGGDDPDSNEKLVRDNLLRDIRCGGALFRVERPRCHARRGRARRVGRLCGSPQAIRFRDTRHGR